ncbi:Hypothetical predicted protein [Octopus vulgaris]|uniref:Uncharacterized protein n=1 Tax=Octopus vulgaris TaxID=6645 RepID=A0AA36F3T7_OCTVU|nr:Hypothetical predicted protein [Octopus vulgaris]
MFDRIEWKIFLPLVLYCATGLADDVCLIQNDQGSTDKVYCKFGCCESLDGIYCCVRDYILEAQYEYGYKIAGAVVGVIVGCVFLVVIFRCLVALRRMNDVQVITVEDDTQHTRSVSMTSREDCKDGNIEMQPPSTISYPQSSFCSYADDQSINDHAICTPEKASLFR